MARIMSGEPRTALGWVPRSIWKPHEVRTTQATRRIELRAQQPQPRYPKRGEMGGACRRTCGCMAPQLPTHMGGVCTQVNGGKIP